MITATVITLNEEANIVACLESLAPVCDELIVVDSGSEDRTLELARAAGASTYTQPYLGDGPQKQFGVQFARNDWILSIDADERLDEEAQAALRALDLKHSKFDGYEFRRKNFVGTHWLRAGGWYPDPLIRLYHKARAQYLPKKAHSRVAARRVERLPGHILHYTYRDYSHWIERINRLSSRDAWAMYDRGKRAGRSDPMLHAISAGLRKYLLKGGIYQGLDGATVTMTTVFRTYMKYLKLIELQEREALTPTTPRQRESRD